MKQIERIEAIASNLKGCEDALALVGVGSIGQERYRLDEFSDLDFFVLVKTGNKSKFINDLSWLDTTEAAIVYSFQETIDGFKVLWNDGLFGEFAVFEESDLETIQLASPLLIWKREEINLKLDFEKNIPKLKGRDFYYNLALTNILVSSLRYKRGEILSAYHFMNSALNNVMIGVTISNGQYHTSKIKFCDKFDSSRRFEQNFPEVSSQLVDIAGNLSQFSQQKQALLSFIESYFTVNESLKKLI